MQMLPQVEENINITINDEYIFKIGELFSSFEELQIRMKLHTEKSFVHYWRRDSRTVKGAYMKTSRIISQRLQYYALRYACVYGGQKFLTRGSGIRRTLTTRSNCPSSISLRATKCGQYLEVTTVCNVHNHEISELSVQLLPQNRKTTWAMKEEALLMLHLQIDKREIIDYIKLRSNKKVTHKDLYNWKSIYKYTDNLHIVINKDIILRILNCLETNESLKSIQYKFKNEISKLKILDVSVTDADDNGTELDKSKNNLFETILIDNNLNDKEDDGQQDQQKQLLHEPNNHGDNENILTEYMPSNNIIMNEIIETDKINEFNDDDNVADVNLLYNEKYLIYTNNRHSSGDLLNNQNVDFICETIANPSSLADQSMDSIIENLELNDSHENNIYDECNEKLFDSVNNNCIIEEYLTLPIIATTTDDNLQKKNCIEFSTECNTNEVNLNLNFNNYNNYYNNINNIIVKRIRRKYKLKCRQCNNLRSLKFHENKIKQNVHRLIQQSELLIQTKNKLLDEVNVLQSQKLLQTKT